MTNVIGPITPEDWWLMRCLKGNLKILRERNTNGKYDEAIRMEKSLLEETRDKYYSKDVA